MAKTEKTEHRYSSPCTLELSPEPRSIDATRAVPFDAVFVRPRSRRAAVADAVAACLTLFGLRRNGGTRQPGSAVGAPDDAPPPLGATGLARTEFEGSVNGRKA